MKSLKFFLGHFQFLRRARKMSPPTSSLLLPLTATLLLASSALSLPMPQSLTEAQFNRQQQQQQQQQQRQLEQPQQESARQHRAVKIFSGYSNVSTEKKIKVPDIISTDFSPADRPVRPRVQQRSRPRVWPGLHREEPVRHRPEGQQRAEEGEESNQYSGTPDDRGLG